MRELRLVLALLLNAVIAESSAQSVLPSWITFGNADVPQVTYRLIDSKVDQAGNTYVLAMLGDSSMWIPNDRACVYKYDTNGQLLWVDSIPPVSYVRQMALAPSGCIYVTWNVWNGVDYDLFLRKLDSDGNHIHTTLYSTAQGYFGGLTKGVSLDPFENLYVIGEQFQQDSACTVKFDSTCTAQWSRYFSLMPNYYDRGHGVATDELGNVYCMLISQSTPNLAQLVLLKYSQNGQLVWQQQYPTSAYLWPKSIAVSHDTSVYISGDHGGDYILIKYDTAGQFQWDRILDLQVYYNYPFPATDQTHAMLVTSNGNIMLTGAAFIGTGAPRRIHAAYNGAGSLLWVRRDFRSAEGHSIAEDANGNIWFSGSARDTIINRDGVGISKYDPLGTCLWSTIYTTGLQEWFSTSFIGIDQTGHGYCATQLGRVDTNMIHLMKFDYATNVDELTNEEPAVQVFPNPATDVISFQFSDAQSRTIIIYDLVGNEVLKQHSSNPFIELPVAQLSSGIYFYGISIEGSRSASGKFVIQH